MTRRRDLPRIIIIVIPFDHIHIVEMAVLIKFLTKVIDSSLLTVFDFCLVAIW